MVNKKRTDKESFDRLKSHVPNLDGKNDVTQLDVLLEAIQYITALRKDLGKEEDQQQLQQQQQQLQQQQQQQQQQQPRQLQPFKPSDVN